jgi:DNA-directed RNA polymerase subunit E'/Rpb7
MKPYTTSSILTTSINVKPSNIKGDINKLLLYILRKKYEGVCNKDGFIIKGSIELLNRSIGEIKTINNESLLRYQLTYKCDIISPSDGDQLECHVESKNKLGIIGIIKYKPTDNATDSPFIIIIPKEYIEDEKIFNRIHINDSIQVQIKSSRIKYSSKQIQIVATLV